MQINKKQALRIKKLIDFLKLHWTTSIFLILIRRLVSLWVFLIRNRTMQINKMFVLICSMFGQSGIQFRNLHYPLVCLQEASEPNRELETGTVWNRNQ